MKKVHPQTKKSIIREHERNTRIKILVRGKVLVDVQLRTLRLINERMGNGSVLEMEVSPGVF